MANVTQCPACGTELGPQATGGFCPQCTPGAAAATVSELLPDTIFADQLTEPIEDGHGTARTPPGLPPSLSGYMIIGPPKRGGMGTVWPAKQLGTKRTVAIKILGTQHLTAAGRERFIREVELSAQLQHPNIARIYDSGVHQGDYFYAMEMIEGLALDEYVKKHKCTQMEILELMRLVCAAVQHAHVRGVIHCDIKPANILVSEDGQPHVLDFGLARLTSSRPEGLTENGSAPGTPSWMSPEQAAGRLERIDTRTDVYSLGKILYHLLTGEPPHRLDGSIGEVLHRIATQEVRPPKKVCPRLSAELCAMLLKALSHDPEARYATAGELGSEIVHYQRKEPLIAVSNSILYSFRKWVRRRRVAVLVGSLLIAVFLGIAAVGEARFRREATNRKLMNDFTQSLLQAITPSNKNSVDPTPQLMQQARVLSQRFAGEPLMQAELAEKLANVLFTFGQLEPAEEQFRTASTLRQKQLGLSDARTLAVKERLAQICRERGKFREAQVICEEILAAKIDKWGEAHRQTLRSAIALAQVLEDKGLLGDQPHAIEEAEKLLRNTVDQCQNNWGATDQVTLEAKAALVLVLRLGDGPRLQEANRLSQETLEARRKTLGRKHRQTIESKHDRASVLAAMGRPNDAEEMYRDALAEALRELGWSSPLGPATEEHPDLVIWLNDLAVTLMMKDDKEGGFAEAQEIYEDILPASIRSRGASHPFNVIIRKNLAASLAGQGRWAEAALAFKEAARVHGENWGGESLGTLNLLDYQAWALTKDHRWQEAAAIYQQTLAARIKQLPPDDPVILASRKQLEIAQSQKSPASRPAATRPSR